VIVAESKAFQVITYRAQYRGDFARLNYAWIEKYFAIEAVDRRVLDDPEREILAKGGEVFFLIVAGRVAGTVALKKEDEATFELTKMAVDEDLRGRGYGQMLLDAAIQYAKDRGMKRLVLSSHTSLTPAIAMYKKSGFVERSQGSSCYSRCNIYMECGL
jgi:ribosomal protein S18 acetylase RimI-like enzyme